MNCEKYEEYKKKSYIMLDVKPSKLLLIVP